MKKNRQGKWKMAVSFQFYLALVEVGSLPIICVPTVEQNSQNFPTISSNSLQKDNVVL